MVKTKDAFTASTAIEPVADVHKNMAPEQTQEMVPELRYHS